MGRRVKRKSSFETFLLFSKLFLLLPSLNGCLRFFISPSPKRWRINPFFKRTFFLFYGKVSVFEWLPPSSYVKGYFFFLEICVLFQVLSLFFFKRLITKMNVHSFKKLVAKYFLKVTGRISILVYLNCRSNWKRISSYPTPIHLGRDLIFLLASKKMFG